MRDWKPEKWPSQEAAASALSLLRETRLLTINGLFPLSFEENMKLGKTRFVLDYLFPCAQEQGLSVSGYILDAAGGKIPSVTEAIASEKADLIAVDEIHWACVRSVGMAEISVYENFWRTISEKQAAGKMFVFISAASRHYVVDVYLASKVSNWHDIAFQLRNRSARVLYLDPKVPVLTVNKPQQWR